MAEQATIRSKIHIASTIVAIMAGMMVLDAYLVEQNTGSRRTGVLVMLLIGDVCLLFVLRYVGVWVGGEVRSTKRGCSMAEWFLVIFVLDIKMYFVLENVRKECFTAVEQAREEAKLEEGDSYVSIFQPEVTFVGDENLSTEELMLTYAQTGAKSAYTTILSTCDYAMATKKTLSVFQAIFVPGFYMLLVGADYLEDITSLRELEEVKMRAFWVIVDLLDLLDLQSSMWESQQGALPYLTVGFIYFYCYIVLIVLPPLSLAEMSKRSETRPHEMIIYLLASFVTVNVATTAIRLVLIFSNNFAGVSAMFIGKNVVCIFFKATKLMQISLVKRRKIRFLRDEKAPFTFNDLRKEHRNHTGFLTEVVMEPIGKESTINVRKGSEGRGSPAMKLSDNKSPELQQNHTDRRFTSKEKLALNLHPDKTPAAKQCDALASKQGSYSSSTTVSQRAAEGVTSDRDVEKQSDTAPWHHCYLEALRRGEEGGSLDEMLNHTLSPASTSDVDKFSGKLSRSFSAILETNSDAGNEKRVRFRKEKLSPVASEGQSHACDPLLTELRDVGVEANPARLLSLPSSESSTHVFSSAENSTSTTDCATQLDNIKEWNSNVIDQIATLRNNLNEAFGNKESPDDNFGGMVNGVNGDMSDDAMEGNDEEDTKFPSRIPSPLPESLPDTCRRCASSLGAKNGPFGSIKSLNSDMPRHEVVSTSAPLLSPSVSTTTVPSSVAASSMLVSPSTDRNLNGSPQEPTPASMCDALINNPFALNGLSSPSLSKASEDEDYLWPQSMRLLHEISPSKKRFSDTHPKCFSAKSEDARRRFVSRGAQTTLADDVVNNSTL